MSEQKTELVPSPDTVKRKLAENYREARILRRLLRLAEQSHNSPERAMEVSSDE